MNYEFGMLVDGLIDELEEFTIGVKSNRILNQKAEETIEGIFRLLEGERILLKEKEISEYDIRVKALHILFQEKIHALISEME